MLPRLHFRGVLSRNHPSDRSSQVAATVTAQSLLEDTLTLINCMSEAETPPRAIAVLSSFEPNAQERSMSNCSGLERNKNENIKQ